MLPHALQDDVAQELTQVGPGRSFQKLSISQSMYKLKVINVGARRYSNLNAYILYMYTNVRERDSDGAQGLVTPPASGVCTGQGSREA